jgi:hypothetical protein
MKIRITRSEDKSFDLHHRDDLAIRAAIEQKTGENHVKTFYRTRHRFDVHSENPIDLSDLRLALNSILPDLIIVELQ